MSDHFPIKGFIKTSFIDWPGKLCSVVFLGGCGFRCPACHNPGLVLNPTSMEDYPLTEVMGYLESRRGWIDGVTVTGGEPTIHNKLPELLGAFRKLGLGIKLDTNGSNPLMLEALISTGLVDAVSMDVKAPLTRELYSRVAGVPVKVELIRRSIEVLKQSGLEVVFRTTVIPGLVEEPQLSDIRRHLGQVTRFVIQSFRNVETLDRSLSKTQEFPLDRVEQMRRQFEIPSSPELISPPHVFSGLS